MDPVGAYTAKCKRGNGTLEYTHMLRCLSRQSYPNGTVISESSQAKMLQMTRHVDDITEDDIGDAASSESLSQTNMGATAVAIIIVIFVFIALAILCYAQRYKVI